MRADAWSVAHACCLQLVGPLIEDDLHLLSVLLVGLFGRQLLGIGLEPNVNVDADDLIVTGG